MAPWDHSTVSHLAPSPPELGGSVDNLPAILEIQIPSLGWDSLEKGMATHSSILAWRAIVHGVAKSRTTERLTHTTARVNSTRTLSLVRGKKTAFPCFEIT